jgi:transposase
VVLASAAGGPVQQVAAETKVSRPMVWRWQQRFAKAGVEGLLRDKTTSHCRREIGPSSMNRWTLMVQP